MNILILSSKLPFPPRDGGAIATLTIAKGFAQLGHHVTILSINTKKHFSNTEEIPDSLKKLIHFEAVTIDTSIKPINLIANIIFSKQPYNTIRFKSKKFNKILLKKLSSQKFDLVQLEGINMRFYIPTIRSGSNATISLRAHNVEHEIWFRNAMAEKNILKKYYLKNLAKRIKQFEIKIFNEVDTIIPITKRDEAIINSLGAIVPTHVAPTGIEKSANIKHNKIEENTIFFIGALDWIPNQEGILWFLNNVWSECKVKYPDLKLYVAGRNAPKWFEKKLKQFSLIYLGEIDDAINFISSKRIMIVPLFAGSGMRIKIIEGMSMGKIIISTSIGAEGIPVTNEKNIFIADTAEGYIHALKKVTTNKEIGDAIAKEAEIFIQENFDNLAICSALVNFYSKLIK